MIRDRPALLLLLVAATSLAPAGCAGRANDAEPPVTPPERFSASGTGPLPGRWWTAFGDAELTALVDEALEDNLDLKIAWQRLREARAVVDRESAALFPLVDASAGAEVVYPERVQGDDLESLSAGLTASYEVDLWGRIRSRADAERYRARASLADYRTVALSLSAEVARTWYLLVEARSQLELLDRQIEANEKVLRLLESRFGSGQIRLVDVLRQRQLLEATREQRVGAEATLEVLQHQLAVLLGRPPKDAVDASRARLPEPPPLPDTGLPSELVRRRPDIRRAYSLLLAADRDVAAAIRARYPRLVLSGSATAVAESATSLFTDWFLSLGVNLLAPLFDGGERAAEVERTEAVEKQRLYAYGQATLLAFREVEDALVQEKTQARRLELLEEQARLARQTYERLQAQYLNGAGNYIDVLTTLAEHQQLRRDLVVARRLLLEFRIALYRALAGGFETDRERE